jgi:manganese-dependent ADP-ribose/CDP-alcohol diphosphatase
MRTSATKAKLLAIEMILLWLFVSINDSLAFKSMSKSFSSRLFLKKSTIFSAMEANEAMLKDKSLFSFGIIADIQYADSPDSMNFQGTRVRRYRQSLDIFRQAAMNWSKHSQAIETAVVLGDIIDARAASQKDQHRCLSHILDICEKSSVANYHFCIGNHCHYNFKRNELYDYLIPKSSKSDLAVGSLHYDWSPHPGWRFIFLDSYDVSLIGHSNEDNLLLAKMLLSDNNPNNLTMSGTWFHNLPFEKKRWVPYNGMISDEQKQWLIQKLSQTVRDNERVMVFCHQPIYSPSKPNSLIWNAEEILAILHASGNVCMWMAGHDHDGNYCQDQYGIHHIIPPAPIEAEEGELAYGHIDVRDEQLILNWTGKQPLSSIMPWPSILDLKPRTVNSNTTIELVTSSGPHDHVG